MVRHLGISICSVIGLTILACAPGCDRTPAGPSAASNSIPSLFAVVPDAPIAKDVSIEPIATLSPHDVTLIAAVPNGDIFCVQNTQDVGQIRAGNGRVDASGLTVASVRAALHLPPGQGRFAAIAPRGDGKIAFCFMGVAAENAVVAIGTFDPKDKTLFIAADPISLRAADPLLAEASSRLSMFADGDDASLWRADKSDLWHLRVFGLSDIQPSIMLQRLDTKDLRDLMERSAWEWSATDKGREFLLTDTASRWIRRIDRNLRLSHVARFDDSVQTVSPAALDTGGRVVVLACDRDGVAQSLLIQNGETFKAIARDSFTGIAADAALRLDRLNAVPGQPNTFVAYEATSGQLMRVKLK